MCVALQSRQLAAQRVEPILSAIRLAQCDATEASRFTLLLRHERVETYPYVRATHRPCGRPTQYTPYDHINRIAKVDSVLWRQYVNGWLSNDGIHHPKACLSSVLGGPNSQSYRPATCTRQLRAHLLPRLLDLKLGAQTVSLLAPSGRTASMIGFSVTCTEGKGQKGRVPLEPHQAFVMITHFPSNVEDSQRVLQWARWILHV